MDVIASAKEVMFSSLFVCLFVSNFVQKLPDLHEIFREGWQWASELRIKFWCRSRSWIRIRIRIATLVRCALADVCAVPVLLVQNVIFVVETDVI